VVYLHTGILKSLRHSHLKVRCCFAPFVRFVTVQSALAVVVKTVVATPARDRQGEDTCEDGPHDHSSLSMAFSRVFVARNPDMVRPIASTRRLFVLAKHQLANPPRSRVRGIYCARVVQGFRVMEYPPKPRARKRIEDLRIPIVKGCQTMCTISCTTHSWALSESVEA
jgi:hypothetical protein